MIAAILSVCANVILLALTGLAALKFEVWNESAVPASPPDEEAAATIVLEAAEVPARDVGAAATQAVAATRRFARTSPDQDTTPAENPAFMGERNTRATSDRTPVPTAPALPSQAGIAPRDESEIETTESDYQDGVLMPESAATPPTEAVAGGPPATEMRSEGEDAGDPAPTAPREALLEGPNPVEVPMPRETTTIRESRTPPDNRKAEPSLPPVPPAPADDRKSTGAQDLPKPKPAGGAAFKGYQRKTAVVGSISRTGRSSLDVADSPLGRYQAAISRAVELEWQRNCVRHRDFITPGYLTVRFFVEAGGKVRSVEFVGDMETGEIQKGFTLNSIRDAEIPPMPPALRREYDEEPLELVFRFYF